MPQLISIATQRFYRAFYRWALSSSSPLPRERCAAAYRRSPLHTSSRSRGTAVATTHADFRIHKELSVHRSKPSWHFAPARNAVEKPFGSFHAFQVVVRHRSEAGVLVETAIPVSRINAFCDAYGKSLERISESSRTTIDVQDVTPSVSKDGVQLRSVLVSGSFRDVLQAVNILRRPLVPPRTAQEAGRRQRPAATELKKSSRSQNTRRGAATDHATRNSNGSALSGKAKKAEVVHDSDDESETSRLFESFSKSDVDIEDSNQSAKDDGMTLREPDTESTRRPGAVDPTIESVMDHMQFRFKGKTRTASFTRLVEERSSELMKSDDPRWQKGLEFQTREGMIHLRGPSAWLPLDFATARRYIFDACNLLGMPKRSIVFFRTITPGALPQGTGGEANSDNQLKSNDIGRNGVDTSDDPRLADGVRAVLRTLTHPVVVVTTSKVRTVDSGAMHSLASCRGVTVSSFNTVTLQPRPTISFNLKVPSRTWDALRESNHMRIHLLADSPEGAAIAQLFTRPYEHGYEPFQHLEERGVTVCTDQSDSLSMPPVIKHDGVVFAQIHANLLPNQCMHVGDHVIVVARVITCDFSHEGSFQPFSTLSEGFAPLHGLAYSNRGYRSSGNEIEPVELPVLENVNITSSDVRKLDPDEMEGNDTAASLVVSDVSSEEGPIVGAKARDTDDDNVKTGTDMSPSTIEETTHMDDSARREDDSGIRSDSTTNIEEPKEQSQTPVGHVLSAGTAQVNEYTAGEDPSVVASSAPSVTGGESNTTEYPYADPRELRKGPPSVSALSIRRPAKSEPVHAWGLTAVAHSRSFGTSSRRTERRPIDSPSGCLNDAKDLMDDIVEPTARNTNVADFLGIPDNNAPWCSPRVRNLVSVNIETRLARLRLQVGTGVAPEEVTELETRIAANERMVARKMGYISALELRLMLDKGRLDAKRTPWLEGSVERGQAVLLESAERAKQMHEDGYIDEVKYQTVKESLGRVYALLTTETMRLRQVVDEEADGSDDDF